MHIKVTGITGIARGEEFKHENYPCEGFFLVNGILMHVYQGAGQPVRSVMSVFDGEKLIEADAAELPSTTPAPVQSGVSENTLLKAIAIAANPALSVDLLKG